MDLSKSLESIISQLPQLYSELWLAILFVALLLIDLILPQRKQAGATYAPIIPSLFGLGLIVNLILIFTISDDAFVQASGITTYEDPWGKVLLSMAGILAVGMQWATDKFNEKRHEFWLLLVSTILGLQLMLISANWLMLYLSIETVSIGSYILTAFKFDKRSAESSLKYLIFGAFSSALMLYGVSLLYGLTGTIHIVDSFVDLPISDGMLPKIALILSFAGLLFKIASVPFHIWSPDVYEIAPTTAVAFFSVAPKTAGILVLHQLVSLLHQKVGILEGVTLYIDIILATLAVASILLGNLVALKQTRLKRLLAYSSIAHAGVFLVAVLGSLPVSMLFYLIIYLIMTFLVFGIAKWSEGRSSDLIEEMMPKLPIWMGVTTLIVAVSFVGLPITAGFTAKMLVFSDFWQLAQQGNSLFLVLFVVGLGSVVVSLFYYMKMPFFALIRRNPAPEETDWKIKLYLGVLGLSLVILFFMPGWLLNYLS